MFLAPNNITNPTIKLKNDPERYFSEKELLISFFLINILIFFVLFSTWTADKKKEDLQRITEGIVDITNYKSDYILLDGEWDFKWYPEIPELINADLIPDYFSESENVPAYWKSGSRGLGIYRLKILYDNSFNIPALKLTNVMDTYKLFVNRKEYYSVGNISPYHDKYIDESRPVVIPLQSCTGEIELCIMVGNLTEKRGGLNRPLIFGEYDTLRILREKKLVYNSILLGISLTVIFYNILFLFVNRRSILNNFFLIILCLTIISYCGLKQEMVLKSIFASLTGETRAKLIYLSFLLPFPIFACYIKSIYTKIFGSNTYIAIILSAALLTGFILFFKSSIFSRYLLYLEAGNLLLAIYLSARLVYLYVKTRDTRPFTQLIGMYIFISGFIAAILDDNLALSSNAPFILLTSFVLFLTAGNTILSIRSFNKLKQLHNALITSEKDKENLRKLSYIDSLTEISNRRHFEEYIKLHWEKTTFIGETTALFMIDIDNFKVFNDTYGHQEGDLCLKKTASAMNIELNRENDIIFRYGGEEFVVIISNITAEDSFKIAEKLRKNVENLRIPNKNSLYSDYVTVSVGISYYNPARKHISWEKTLREADSALYRAKISKNCCLLFADNKQGTGEMI